MTGPPTRGAHSAPQRTTGASPHQGLGAGSPSPQPCRTAAAPDSPRGGREGRGPGKRGCPWVTVTGAGACSSVHPCE